MKPTPEQRDVIETWGRGMAVQAGAGTGKTTTLVAKCAALIARNPEARFAAVSFTERSAGDLRAKLAAAIPLERHWVMTIHGLCGSILRENPRASGFDGEETILAESEAALLWESAVDSLWHGDPPEPVLAAMERLLEREGRPGLVKLLRRSKELRPFGLLRRIAPAEEGATPTDLQSLGIAASYVIDRYERLKRRRGALDFDDLEAAADRALEDTSVRGQYHSRFELLLVDEFQDTNPVQARIVSRLARRDLSNLVVVGDPKQSIYRFRDADLSVFEEVCASLPEKRRLTWNFRSRPGVLEFTNRVCAAAFPSSRMEYAEVVPQRERLEDLEPVIRLPAGSPEELARWIRGEVARGIPLGEMALLVRRIRGSESWLRGLAAAGVPVAVGSGGLFWEDPRVRELVAFLRWWDNPGNSLSGAVFLRAPWVGVADTDLDEWVRLDPTFVRPFFASSHPLARRLAPLRAAGGGAARPGELLLSLLVSDALEAELGAPLLGLWHRAEGLSSRGLPSSAVVAEFSQAVEEGRREREVPPPRSSGSLSVLTLHAAKGLEYPHVILLGFEGKRRNSDAPLLYWDRARGPFLARRDESGDRERGDPEEGAWKSEERERSLAESKRLFYVAATRAKERLVLVMPPLDEEAAPDAYAQDNWRGWVEASGAGIPEAAMKQAGAPEPAPADVPGDPSPAAAAAARAAAPVLRLPRHSVTEWSVLARCPRAYEWGVLGRGPQGAGVPEDPRRAAGGAARGAPGIDSRELGTRVHACLETGDLEGLRALEQEAGAAVFRAEPLARWARESPWMRDADPSAGRSVWKELAFEVPVEGEVLVGAIDRLVVEESASGRRATIIDFKVTRSERAASELLEAYSAQLSLYAFAVGELEPSLKGATRALLVHVSPGGVREVEVPGDPASAALAAASLSRAAAKTVAGAAGPAMPSALCRTCDHQRSCPEGLKSLNALR